MSENAGKVLKDYPAGNLPLAANPPFRQSDYALHGERRGIPSDLARSQQSAMRHPVAPDFTVPSFHVYDIRTDEMAVTTCLVKVGWVQARNPILGEEPLPWVLPTISGTAMKTTRIVIEVAKTLYCRVETNSDDLAFAATIVSETPVPASTHAQPAQQDIDMMETVSEVSGEYYYRIADFTTDASGNIEVLNQYQSGGPIMHAPGRNGHSSSLRIVDCDGNAVAFLNIKQGLETTNLGYKEIECGCDGGTTSSASPSATTYRQEGAEQ